MNVEKIFTIKKCFWFEQTQEVGQTFRCWRVLDLIMSEFVKDLANLGVEAVLTGGESLPVVGSIAKVR